MAAAAPIPKELELEPGWWLKITGEEAIRVAVSAMCHAYADVEAASARVAHLERRDLDRLRTSELVVLYAVIRGLSADVQCFEGPRLDLLMASFSEAAIRVQVVRDAYLPRARRVLGRLAQIAVAIEGRKSRASRATVRRRQLDLELALELAG